jgi:hypothetical protein
MGFAGAFTAWREHSRPASLTAICLRPRKEKSPHEAGSGLLVGMPAQPPQGLAGGATPPLSPPVSLSPNR